MKEIMKNNSEFSEPVYRIMMVETNHIIENVVYGSIQKARSCINDLISESSSLDYIISVCIMSEHYERFWDNKGILIESVKVLKRAENCFYTNFNGVEVTNVIIRKPL